jgi:heavy metal sensor kinase
MTLIVFAIFAWLTIRGSLYAAIDADLRERAAGLSKLLRDDLTSRPRGDVQAELAEHAGDALQIRDERGAWLHRAPPAIQAGVDLPALDPDTSVRLDVLTMTGVPYRSLTSTTAAGGHLYTFQIVEPLRDVESALRQFTHAMLWTAPIMLLVAAGGGYWMSRRALSPVDAVTSTARAITAGNLSRRLLVPRTGDEVQRLSETLNSMLERLEGAFRQTRQFTADASHELRTPVAYMRTVAEVLLRQPRTNDEWRKGVGDIHGELTRISALIESLMTLARADAGAEPRRFSRIDLRDPIRAACRQGTAIGSAKGVDVSQEVDTGPVWLDADRELLERLFVILIDNAVKYTPADGSVTVTLTARDASAITEVSDTGIGIGADDLPHVFERFYRSDRARSRDTGGSGLGLAIARWIVDLHGGTIAVESEPGRGSVFRVVIPAA